MIALRLIFGDIIDSSELPLESDSRVVVIVTALQGTACGDRLREVRKRLGLSQAKLAELAELSAYRVSRAEREPGSVSIGDINGICEVLAVELAKSLGILSENQPTKEGKLRKAARGASKAGGRTVGWLSKNPRVVQELIEAAEKGLA